MAAMQPPSPRTTSSRRQSILPRPSSIRQSLNIGRSVSKALGDIINKDTSVPSIRGKDSRRLSVQTFTPTTNDSERKDTPSPSPAKRAKTTALTSPAKSGTMPEPPRKTFIGSPRKPQAVPAPPPLRPRSSTGTSALPKMKPKSTLHKPPPTPSKGGITTPMIRKRTDSVEGSSEDQHVTGAEPGPRSVSPLPKRAAAKLGLVFPSVGKNKPPTPIKGNPVKSITPTRRVSDAKTPHTRPPSSTSQNTHSSSLSSGSRKIPAPVKGSPTVPSPRSAKTPTTPRSALPRSSPASKKLATSTNSSPSSRRGGSSHSELSSAKSVTSPLPSDYDASMDIIDAGDVSALLEVNSILSPVKPGNISTPALKVSSSRRLGLGVPSSTPKTPSRQGFLPPRDALSYASPQPPTPSSTSQANLRPPLAGVNRGSILSWEQLAEFSKTKSGVLEEEDLENMLADVKAPFRSTPSTSGRPRLDSDMWARNRVDSGWGLDSPSPQHVASSRSYEGTPVNSISQVLFPSAEAPSGRPSPCPRDENADAALIAHLRLQLAAAESRADEELARATALEVELRKTQEQRDRDVLEEGEKSMQLASLGDELRHLQHQHEERARALAEREAREARLLEEMKGMKDARRIARCADAALCAKFEWGTVREIIDGETDMIRASREALKVILAEIDVRRSEIIGASSTVNRRAF